MTARNYLIPPYTYLQLILGFIWVAATVTVSYLVFSSIFGSLNSGDCQQRHLQKL